MDCNDSDVEDSTIDRRNYSRPEYMNLKYKDKKQAFDKSLDEFDINLFVFKSWNEIKNKYIKQYLIINYVTKVYTERRYNMRYATKLYEFIQSGLNSKTIKAQDIEFHDNAISTITSIIITGPTEFTHINRNAEECIYSTSNTNTKIPLINKLWLKHKTNTNHR